MLIMFIQMYCNDSTERERWLTGWASKSEGLYSVFAVYK
jgi:hypothetical protein